MDTIYLEGTNQRAIILLHAYTSSYVDVNLIGKDLHKQGYTVCMPTLAGHGTKDMHNILLQSVTDYRDTVHNELKALNEKGYTQIAIFGLSLGGMLSIDVLTQQRNDVVGGGSFNSPIPLIDVAPIVEQFVIYANHLYTNQFGEQSVYLEMMKNGATKQLSDIQEVTYDVYSQLNRIEVPVFIAQSLQDELIPSDTGERLAQSIPYAPVELHLFEQAKHAITVGKSRQALYEKLYAFIESLNWRN